MARRTKEEAQETRNALLDAAEHVFSERGVSRTSLTDVAAAAGGKWHHKAYRARRIVLRNRKFSVQGGK